MSEGIVLIIAVAAVLAVAAFAGYRAGLRRARPTAEAGRRARVVVTIEIHDHAAVARSRSWLAGPLALAAPRLVRDVVNRELVRELRRELRDQGVDATVALRRWPGVEPEVPSAQARNVAS